MPAGNNPFAAKNAAALVNPTSLTVFPQLVTNTLATAPIYSAYVQYQVFNNSVSTTSQTAVLYGAHGENVNAVKFNLRAFGRVTGGTTTNFTPTLQFGRSTTAGSNTTMGSLTARAFNTASGMFDITTQIIWDVTSGQISGTIQGLNGATAAIDAAALITPVTGQTAAVLAANAQPNSFFFSIGGLFSATNASNIAYLDYFALEDV